MKVFALQVRVQATMYVKAKSEAHALKLAKERNLTEVRIDSCEENVVSSGRFDSPVLPVLSLSPVGTMYVPKTGIAADIECVWKEGE